MKKCIPILIAFFCCIISMNAQNEFITTWKTDNLGASSNSQITIRTYSIEEYNDGEVYNYEVDWTYDGDNFNPESTGVTGNITHDYGDPGTYTVAIRGTFPRIYFHGVLGDRNKILTIEQWGDNPWTSMKFAFSFCENLTITNPNIDTPNLSQVTELTTMFNHCYNFNGDVSQWDVSNVNVMYGMFREARMFNQDLSNWDVSNVTNMVYMFEGADDFNQSLGNWDISSLSNATDMFRYTGLSTTKYDSTILGWATDTSGQTNDGIDDIPTNIVFNGGSSNYCSATPERLALENTYSWNITDNGWESAFCIENSFITSWKTDNPGDSNNNQITIPTFPDETYDYTVYWGDGQVDNNVTGSITHTYTSAGTYTIAIVGDFPRIYFNASGDKDKLLTIEQWGNISWTSMENAFSGCSNLNITNTTIDTPNLSNVNNLNSTFNSCTIFNGDISGWDVSNVEYMQATFLKASAFNQNIGNWNVSNVKNMKAMFREASSFNQNIGGWVMTNVESTQSMFRLAEDFNQDISNWDVQNVTSMSSMFLFANRFNQDISNWNVSSVSLFTNTFQGAASFDQNLADWDLSSVTNMTDMFNNVTISTTNYDLILKGWATDTSGVDDDGIDDIPTNLNFHGGNSIYCTAAAEHALLDNTYSWDIIDGGPTEGCIENAFITTWKTDNPGITNDNQITIPTWGAETYDYTVDWGDGTMDTNVTGNIIHTYAQPGTYTVKIFGEFPRIRFAGTVNNDKDKIETIEQWGHIQWSSMAFAFEGCTNLNVTATDAPNFSNTTRMDFMFKNCYALEGDLGHWDVSTIENMNESFLNANNFNSDIGGWNTANVQTLTRTFDGASSFDQSLANWDLTNASNLSNMLDDTNMSIANYDATLIGWAYDSSGNPTDDIDNIPTGISFGAGASIYCNAQQAWNTLDTNFDWTINDAGQDPFCNPSLFRTTWKTDEAGDSNNNQITIPTLLGEVYNYTVYWGDGSSNTGVSGNITHTYDNPGTYTVVIEGAFPRIYFNNQGDKEKLQTIENWGDYPWTSMENAFFGCTNLNITNPDIDSPNLSDLDNMVSMFNLCENFNGDISNWDVSNVELMDDMFREASMFNQDISQWNVSSVTSMIQMFREASAFNQDISQWNVGEVTNMDGMFLLAYEFNQDIGNWNVAKVTNMINMFRSAQDFDQNLGNWDITSVSDMTDMFKTNSLSTSNYDFTIMGWATDSSGDSNDGIDDIPSNIIFNGGSSTFCLSEVLIEDLEIAYNWEIEDAGPSPDCNGAFITTWKTDNAGPSNNNQITIPTVPGEIYNYAIDWGDGSSDVGITGDITHTYQSPGTYTVSITGLFPRISFRSSSVPDYFKLLTIEQWGDNPWTSMETAFWGCHNLQITNPDIDTPNLSQATSLKEMFSICQNFNSDISNWDISTITDVSYMFQNAASYDQNLGPWDIGNLEDASFMFDGAGLSTSNYDLTLMGWLHDESADIFDDIDQRPDQLVFDGGSSTYCVSEDARDSLTGFYEWEITDGGPAVDCTNGFITTWKTDNTGGSEDNQVNMPIYPGEIYAYNIDWGDGNTDFGQTGSRTHTYASAGTYTITISGLFPGINFASPDSDAQKLLTIEQWGSNPWTHMESAFYGCTNLEITNPDIDSPNLSLITSLVGTFDQCANLNAGLSGWDVSHIENMSGLFASCTNFNGDISNWDVSRVTDMGNMFAFATNFNQDIGNWDVYNVEQMSGMFYEATNFDQNLGNWDISMGPNMQVMFSNAGLSTSNYDATIMGWATDSSGSVGDGADDIPSNISLNGGNSMYCVAEPLWNELDSTYNWTITDAGLATDCNNTGFITTWETTSANEQITIPTFPGKTYNYTVDWGDGNSDSGATGDISHAYSTPGIHTITITGLFPSIFFPANASDSDKIQTIEQWGDNPWEDLSYAFLGCSNLNITNAFIDIPNLTNVTSLEFMFGSCTNFNGDITHWDLSTIKKINNMFELALSFNQNLNNWDVSNVEEMRSVFKDTEAFNQPLDNWDVSSVVYMDAMFENSLAFNQDLSNWEVVNVDSFASMFKNAQSFDQSLGDWDLTGAPGMGDMFLNSSLSTANYDLTIMGWATDSSGTPSDGVDDIPSDIIFNGGNSTYCVAEPFWNELDTTFNWTFADAGLAPDCNPEFITTWQVDNIVNPIHIPIYFGEDYYYTIDWGDGTIETGITGSIIHHYNTTGTYTIKIKGLFPGINLAGLTTGDYLQTIEQWGDNPWTRMEGSYLGCDNLNITNPSIDEPELSNVTSLANMFYGCFNFNGDISNWDVSQVEDMTNMFRDASLFNQNIGNWDVSQVQHMQHMFANATSFNQDIGNWNVSNTTFMGFMFLNAQDFDQSLANWNLNGDGVFMNAMFFQAGISQTNYDDTLIGWATDTSGNSNDGIDDIPSNVLFNAGSSIYCDARNQRSLLMNQYDWTIYDGGIAENCLDGFVTIWETDIAGQSNNNQILIPTHPDETYDYTVDWGDGTVDVGITGDALHTYSVPGTYTVTIAGLFPRIYFNDSGDKDKLQSIEKWGDNPWSSMENAFFGCSALEINDTSLPIYQM